MGGTPPKLDVRRPRRPDAPMDAPTSRSCRISTHPSCLGHCFQVPCCHCQCVRQIGSTHKNAKGGGRCAVDPVPGSEVDVDVEHERDSCVSAAKSLNDILRIGRCDIVWSATRFAWIVLCRSYTSTMPSRVTASRCVGSSFKAAMEPRSVSSNAQRSPVRQSSKWIRHV